jgi:xanthosine utilization system XapX-like protein
MPYGNPDLEDMRSVIGWTIAGLVLLGILFAMLVAVLVEPTLLILVIVLGIFVGAVVLTAIIVKAATFCASLSRK